MREDAQDQTPGAGPTTDVQYGREGHSMRPCRQSGPNPANSSELGPSVLASSGSYSEPCRSLSRQKNERWYIWTSPVPPSVCLVLCPRPAASAPVRRSRDGPGKRFSWVVYCESHGAQLSASRMIPPRATPARDVKQLCSSCGRSQATRHSPSPSNRSSQRGMPLRIRLRMNF